MSFANPRRLSKKERRRRRLLKRQRRKAGVVIQPPHPYMPYAQYLETKWWKTKRRQKLKSTDGKCQRCGQPATQVHHLHYLSLWCEKNADLESICGPCHEREHECLVQCDRHMRSIAQE